MANFEYIEFRFKENMTRVQWLVGLHRKLPREFFRGTSDEHGELLRAAVVLLHASLEDMLRSLAELKLPSAPPKSLDRIPLANSVKPVEKFTLVELAEFRGQSVDWVISRSVEAHLRTSSYNHPGEIAELLAKIGVDYKIDKARRNALAAMMSRRHQIAHSADRHINPALSFSIIHPL